EHIRRRRILFGVDRHAGLVIRERTVLPQQRTFEVHRRAHLERSAGTETENVPAHVRIRRGGIELEVRRHARDVRLFLEERAIEAQTEARGAELLAPLEIERLVRIEIGIRGELVARLSRSEEQVTLTELGSELPHVDRPRTEPSVEQIAENGAHRAID